jgi:hypothetical protein
VGGAGLEWGKIDSNAPESTKNLKLFFVSAEKLSFLQVRKAWLWLIATQSEGGGAAGAVM